MPLPLEFQFPKLFMIKTMTFLLFDHMPAVCIQLANCFGALHLKLLSHFLCNLWVLRPYSPASHHVGARRLQSTWTFLAGVIDITGIRNEFSKAHENGRPLKQKTDMWLCCADQTKSVAKTCYTFSHNLYNLLFNQFACRSRGSNALWPLPCRFPCC